MKTWPYFLSIFIILTTVFFSSLPFSMAQQGANSNDKQPQSQEEKEGDQKDHSPHSNIPSSAIMDLAQSMGMLKEIQELHNQDGKIPLWKQITHVITDPSFLASIRTLGTSPGAELFIFLEGIAWVLILFFRSWRFSSRQISFLQCLWIDTWTISMGLLILLFIIPLALFQKSFLGLIIIISTLWVGQSLV